MEHTSDSTAKQPKHRTRRGCLTCRKRKVKCDEQPGTCQNCHRLSAQCLWEAAVTSRPLTRSRKSRACDRCRGKKMRCVPLEGSEDCKTCVAVGMRCKSPRSNQNPPPWTPSSVHVQQDLQAEANFLDKASLATLLEKYFAGPHQFCFYTFVHRNTFMRMLENNLLPRPLLLIVAATTLRSDDPKSALSDCWADECRETVVRDVFSRVSTVNLQTLLLLQRYEWHRGSHISAWFTSSLAVRLAQALQLYIDPSEKRVKDGGAAKLPVTVMETRRRLIWSCFVMDTIPDAGDRAINPVIDPGVIKVKLPCDEDTYEKGLESDMHPLQETAFHTASSPNISALLVRMTALRQRVLQYAVSFMPRSEREPAEKEPWVKGSRFHQLLDRLNHMRDQVPGLFTPKDAKVERCIGTFTFHSMLHAVYTDLLRVGLLVQKKEDKVTASPSTSAHSPAPRDFIETCRANRISHARQIAEVVSASEEHDMPQHDPFLAIVACLAIRILIVEARAHEIRDPEPHPQNQGNLDSLLQACRLCALRTARWSKPIHRLLLAVSELVSRYGFKLDLPESLINVELSKPVSRAGTPGFHVYGTAANIARAREDHDLESVQGQINASANTPASAPKPLSETSSADRLQTAYQHEVLPSAEHDDTLMPQDSLTPETLRLAYNFENGVYDIDSFSQTDWIDPDWQWTTALGDDTLDPRTWTLHGMTLPF